MGEVVVKTTKRTMIPSGEGDSGWRGRTLRDAGGKLAFATLVLASVIDDAECAMASNGQLGADELASTIDALRRSLMTQERMNEFLPTEAVREGSRHFRAWCEKDALHDLPALRTFTATATEKTSGQQPKR
ncbi:MAG: hypothetical protein OQJ87_02080 [Rhodospirillales bacterium]|nr:hypothetical protein [Rhodospirillales bacterium]